MHVKLGFPNTPRFYFLSKPTTKRSTRTASKRDLRGTQRVHGDVLRYQWPTPFFRPVLQRQQVVHIGAVPKR